MSSRDEIRLFADAVNKLAQQVTTVKEADHVGKQHLISEVLLKRFCEPDRNGDPKLTSQVLAYGHPMSKSTGGVGFVKDFVRFKSGSLERLWKEIEDHLPPVFAALDAKDLAEDQTKILRETIALHWARRLLARDMNNEAFAEAIDRSVSKRSLMRLAWEKHHRVVTDPVALEEIRKEVFGPSETLNSHGVLLRNRIERTFRAAREFSRHGALKIYDVPPGGELIIGDNPVVVHDLKGHVAPRTALFDYGTMTMPMGPRVLVQIDLDGTGTATSFQTMTQDETDHFNRLQIDQAHSYVLYRSGSDLREFVDRARLKANGGRGEAKHET